MTEPLTGISAFLRDCVAPAVERDSFLAMPDWFALRSHLGLVRTENEDRAVLARWVEREPMWVAAIADGIGSGRAASEAATITLARFIGAVIEGRRGLEQRLTDAAEQANRAVFDRWRGKEGATLSAVVVRGRQSMLVNIGDSRIHGIDREDEIVLLTKDDILPNIMGLLQFVGMGKDLAPHVHSIDPRFVRVLITSDGAHNFMEPVLPRLVRAARSDMHAIIDRMTQLGLWFGGGDNATSIMASFEGGRGDTGGSALDVFTPSIHHSLAIERSVYSSRSSRGEGTRARRDDLEPPSRRDHGISGGLGQVAITFSDEDAPDPSNGIDETRRSHEEKNGNTSSLESGEGTKPATPTSGDEKPEGTAAAKEDGD